MEKYILKATRRNVTGKKVGVLRRQGKLPAIMYGYNIEPTAITLDLRDASRTLAGLSGSTLITIDLEGQESAVLVRERQKDYILNVLLHVDFQVVSLTEKIRARVSVVMEGLAPAIKDFNGVVVTGLDAIEVEALPQDLPDKITLDISNLKAIGDGIYVRDVKVSDNVVILSDAEEMLVVITGAEKEEEVVVAVAEEVVAEPEVIEKGKKEEEEVED
jgi:large subunit ribosomal protein L25